MLTYTYLKAQCFVDSVYMQNLLMLSLNNYILVCVCMLQEQERQQRERNCHALAKIFKKMPSITYRTTWAEVSMYCVA